MTNTTHENIKEPKTKKTAWAQVIQGTGEEIAVHLERLKKHEHLLLIVPEEETDDTQLVEEKNTEEPTKLSRRMDAMMHRTPEQLAQAQARAMEAYPPRRLVPPGKTLADVVSGQWPGDETDEQIKAALEELS